LKQKNNNQFIFCNRKAAVLQNNINICGTEVKMRADRLLADGYRLPDTDDAEFTGDMPGDIVNIVDGHIKKAKVLFPEILGKMAGNNRDKVVISVAGGSGAGKTGVALLISYYLSHNGINSYTLSGDNYPCRIPVFNDAERLRIFRDGGIAALLAQGMYTEETGKILLELQNRGLDADKTLAGEKPWLLIYQEAGEEALRSYLGTENELRFGELSAVLESFKNGKKDIWLRRMGRKEHEIWYSQKDFSQIQVLVLEWTHGNSPYLKGCDISVVLFSTPQTTLQNRKNRNRDKDTDSPFTTMVLKIEQEQINQGLCKADILLDSSKNIILAGKDVCNI